MTKHPQLQRLMFLFAIAGLVAAAANFACLEDVCADMKTAQFRTTSDLEAMRIQTLAEALRDSGLSLDSTQRATLKAQGRLFGVVALDRPVKHPNGEIEMPANYLPELSPDHPWAGRLTPADDAFYSFFEERILNTRLYDPSNPQHQAWAKAYLDKSRSNSPEFIGWTYASRTECAKKKFDAEDEQPLPDAF